MSDAASKIASLWEEYAPRIQEAQRRDIESKEEVFLPWYEEEINGLPAVQLTPRRYLLLSVSNALLGEQNPTTDSLYRFLWIVSPSFQESKWRFRYFRMRCRLLDVEETTQAVGKYLERAFRFQPGSSGNGKASGDWVSSLCDTIASEYGWSLESIMNTPISILLLLCSRIKARYTGKAVTFSSEADKLKAEYLQKVNQEGAA